MKRPLVELTLVATGEMILVFYEGTVFEAVSGQEWIIEVLLRGLERDKILKGISAVFSYFGKSRPIYLSGSCLFQDREKAPRCRDLHPENSS